MSKLSKITRIKLFLKENSWTVPDQFGSPDLDIIWGGESREASSWHYMADPSGLLVQYIAIDDMHQHTPIHVQIRSGIRGFRAGTGG